MMNGILLNIISWLEAHELPCLIKNIFHVECPGCGLQRSFIALLQGNILQSLQYYPALLPLILFIVVIIINNKFRITNTEKFIKFGLPSIFAIILLSYINKTLF
jgi:hypothetical protein